MPAAKGEGVYRSTYVSLVSSDNTAVVRIGRWQSGYANTACIVRYCMLGPIRGTFVTFCGNIGDFFLVALMVGPELPLMMCIFVSTLHKLRKDKMNGKTEEDST